MKHSKNSTSKPYFTSSEKSKLKYGTIKERLTKDALKPFDHCSLTLSPLVDPVCTPFGYVYSRAPLLENFLQQKKEIKKQLKQFEKQEYEKEKKEYMDKEREKEKKIQEFKDTSNSIKITPKSDEKEDKNKIKIDSTPKPTSSSSSTKSLAIYNQNENNYERPDPNNFVSNYWLPSEAPKNIEKKVKKPESKLICPASGMPIKLKDLITMNFDVIPIDDRKPSGDSSCAMYKCPLCYDIFNNSTQCILLRLTGRVICKVCYVKFVQKEMKEPFTGQRLKKKDIIMIEKGGTGFVGNDKQKAQSKKVTPAFLSH